LDTSAKLWFISTTFSGRIKHPLNKSHLLDMKKIYTFHKILGLITSTVFIVVCLTGFFLLFRGEMTEGNSNDTVYDFTESTDSTTIWSYTNDAIAAVYAQYPSAQVESIRLYEFNKRLSLRCRVDGKRMRLFYDVTSKSILSPNNAVEQGVIDGAMQQFSRIHKNLGLGRTGRNMLYFLCILTVLTIVSGYYINYYISRQVPLGIIRKNSRRLWLSDWHRFISAVAGPWALIMTLSGVLIFGYSDMTKLYYNHAYETVNSASNYEPMREVVPDEVISQLLADYPSKKIVNMVMPAVNDGFYEVQLAEVRENTSLYSPYELVLVQGNNINNRIFIPDSVLRSILAEALNIHIHNHYLIVTKILWGIMALLSVVMAVSGGLLYSTRWWNNTNLQVVISKKDKSHGYYVASISAVLTIIAMIIPLLNTRLEYGAAGAFLLIFIVSAFSIKQLN